MEDVDVRPSPATRLFFYHANAIYRGWPAEACADETRRGLLRYLARGADPSVPVLRVSATYPTSSALSVGEFALNNLRQARCCGREWLDVYEALIGAEGYYLTDLARVLLWYCAVVNDFPALTGALVRRRVVFPRDAAEFESLSPHDPFPLLGGRWEETVRRARAAALRALHTRNVFLGGRGPAGPTPKTKTVFVPADVWREVFAFLVGYI